MPYQNPGWKVSLSAFQIHWINVAFYFGTIVDDAFSGSAGFFAINLGNSPVVEIFDATKLNSITNVQSLVEAFCLNHLQMMPVVYRCRRNPGETNSLLGYNHLRAIKHARIGANARRRVVRSNHARPKSFLRSDFCYSGLFRLLVACQTMPWFSEVYPKFPAAE
jgi:hypothetical protein